MSRRGADPQTREDAIRVLIEAKRRANARLIRMMFGQKTPPPPPKRYHGDEIGGQSIGLPL